MQITMESSRNPGNGTLSTKISSKFNVCNLNIDKLQLTQDANGVLESTIQPFQNTTIGFNGNNQTANLTLEYKNGNFVTSTLLDIQEFQSLKNNVKLSLSSGVSLASNICVDLQNNKMKEMNLGCNYEQGNWFASLRSVSGMCRFDTNMNLGLLYRVNPKVIIASNFDHCHQEKSRSCITVGGLYRGNFCDLKMKANCCGNLNLSVKKEVMDGVNVMASLGGKCGEWGSWKGGLGVTI